MVSITDKITNLDFFKRSGDSLNWKWNTGTFIGRPYKLSYNDAFILTCDAWKEEANGIPQGCFLLAYYDCDLNNKKLQEAILLRVLEPAELPTDKDVISSMVEYYKDNLRTGSHSSTQLDEYSRYEFSFGGLKCRALGCFYLDDEEKIRFGADIENFYSAHHYSVIKPNEDILNFIVNYRSNGLAGANGDIQIGKVRYSSSTRFKTDSDVPLYVQAKDFAGKRTALFGMTRTGKSNTIKKIIQANENMSLNSTLILDQSQETNEDLLEPFKDEWPKYPIGQIVFDMNGEYANKNLQDEGTAIFEIYQNKTERYSIVNKEGFKVLKVNFYNELEAGFELIRKHPSISDAQEKYIVNFRSCDIETPKYENPYSLTSDERGIKNRYEKLKSIYLSCLYRAKFSLPQDFTIELIIDNKLLSILKISFDNNKKVPIEKAANFWESFWDTLATEKKQEEKPLTDYLANYQKKNEKKWLSDDMEALLVMLTQDRECSGKKNCTGYRILRGLSDLHTPAKQAPFEEDILNSLRIGKIVIIDLSSGEEEIQRMYSERISQKIFRDAMRRFTNTKPNNFIQFYFEEAHNLFPKKENSDLSQIYNRIAKEGAKLNLGLVYATQEVSSVSSNILKATQNWFISHLNNFDEIKELKKYYDFSDFAESLVKFSQDTDKGFARVKTYSNAFVVPVQIDKFCKVF